MTLPSKKKFDIALPLVDAQGRPTQVFRDYMSALDTLVTAMAAGNLPVLVVAVDDAAAAAAGVPLGGSYRAPTVGAPPNTTSALRVRVS